MKKNILLISILLLTTKSFGITIKEFKIVNYFHKIPTNPIFIVDVNYEIEKEKHEKHHSHLVILVEGTKKEKFNIEQNTIFQIKTNNNLRIFLPIFSKLPKNTNQKFSFKLLENSKVLFETNTTFYVSDVIQEPIILLDYNEIEIPKSYQKQYNFFFVSQTPQNVFVINTKEGKTNTVKSSKLEKIKGLHSFSYKFDKEGEYKILIGKSEKTITVNYDKTPPIFNIITPTNNSIFYRTKKIQIKWTDPIDTSGINFQKSSLYIRKNSKVITNISPLISLNRESSITPYETIYIENLEEGEYEYCIEYSDYEGNKTNVVNYFKILPPSEDKEKPIIKNIHVENSKRVSENKYLLKSTNVYIFVEFTDGEYGSGVKSIHYKVNDKIFSDNTFGDNKYISITTESKETQLMIWVEDYNNNVSETNVLMLKP